MTKEILLPGTGGEYVPLFPLLAEYWDKPLSELPEELRARINNHPHGMLWDVISPEQRRDLITCIDIHNTEDGQCDETVKFGYHAAIARDHGSINWKSWSLPYWTPREAACLMVELDPQHYDSVKSSRNPQDRVLADYVDATERMATREQESGLLPGKTSPCKWLEWAQSKGRMVPDKFHEIARAGLPQATGESGGAKLEAGTGTTPAPVVTTHKIQTRTNPLDAEIKIAKEHALDKTSVQSVWDALVKMADSKQGCLLGHGNIDEIKYGSCADPKIFTMNRPGFCGGCLV